MSTPKKRLLIYLDQELADWLDAKAERGYNRTGLIRKVLDDYRKAEINGSSN